MLGLSFFLEVPYFACFRRPTTTSTIVSYPVPPFTTIRGLLASCLGYIPRDSLFLQERVALGVKVERTIELNSEFSKVLKGISREKIPFKRSFPSSPMSRQFLVRPRYKIFISGNRDMVADLAQNLEQPQRPLYLGQSDDFVIVDELLRHETERTNCREISSAFEGIHPGCEVVTLPYRYVESKRGSQLEYKTVSIPPKYPFDTGREIPCHRFGEGLFVQLL